MNRWVFFLVTLLQCALGLPLVLGQSTTYQPTLQVERLLEAQRQYEQINQLNQWVTLENSVCVQACEKDPVVVALKKNLQLTGDLSGQASEQDSLFDQNILEALIKFQRRNGLLPDGIMGPQTLEALNTTPAQRLVLIEANLHRWRLASQVPPQRMVLVNLPDFNLHLLDSLGVSQWHTRVIVGQNGKAFQTVPLESRIGYMVLNPTWTVPQSILRREIVPMVKNDPSYLARNNMLVYRIEKDRKIQVSGQELLSSPTDVANQKLWVVQQPGKDNALGKIKFMFPNAHDIYLHDTPSRNLFAHPVRAYSHGCVRVENPELLGTYLMSNDWSHVRKVSEVFWQKQPNVTLYAPKPVPLQLAYYTAWVNDSGQLQFRKDLYGLDQQKHPALL